MVARLILIDDDQGQIGDLQAPLAQAEIKIDVTRHGAHVVESIKQQRPDIAIMAASTPDGPEMLTLRRLRQSMPRLPVIMIGGTDAGSDAAIEAIKHGARDFLTLPVDTKSLQQQIADSLRWSRLQRGASACEIGSQAAATTIDGSESSIIGRCEPMQQVYKMIGRVACEDVTVLIVGESGTGKELVAHAIHQHSRRADRPFLAINCAAIPEPLLESELFGHERGAFTGADQRRIGKFEQADGGTLFLDELGDMSPTIQAKFLRILQDGRFERVGSNETVRSNVRIIAATNQDLDAKIAAQRFRSDLYYRLSGFTVPLPPLRDRAGDIPLLVEYFLKSHHRHQADNAAVRVSDEVMAILQQYTWPGNVRELQNAITYAVVHAVGEVITPECLPESCRAEEGAAPQPDLDQDLAGVAVHIRRRLRAGESGFYHELIRHIDQIAMQETLEHVEGNQVQASRRLGVSRNTLRSKLIR